MTLETNTKEDNRSSSEIESDIRKARGRMDSTLDELGNRLSARSLMNSALDWWDSPDNGNHASTAVRKVVATLASQARSHPMPAVLIGAGVAWLISESVDHKDEPSYGPNGSNGTRIPSDRNGDGHPVGDWVDNTVEGIKDTTASAIDSVRDKSQQIGNKLQDATERLEERAHGVMDMSRSAVRHVGHDLKGGYHVVEKKFTQACDEYPLAVGVAFAALGALAGLVIPRTRREDDLMGERSDKLVDETKGKAGELFETGKEVGVKVMETIKDQAQEQGFTADKVGETLSELADRGADILQKAKAEAIHAAEDAGIKLPSGSPDADQKPIPNDNPEVQR